MASNISDTGINSDFPIAGQDNDSQGFRDNFTTIKANFVAAKTEIESIQTNGAVKNADNNFLGNTIYSDRQLFSVLKIGEGDTYNGVELEKRIADSDDPNANDLTNLYQNSGYLFSSITPVEVSADGNVIDLEIQALKKRCNPILKLNPECLEK